MNEEKLMKSFGKRVALVRKSKGVTQQQLAKVDIAILFEGI